MATVNLVAVRSRRYDMDLRDERELAFQRLLCICRSDLVSITDFRSISCPRPVIYRMRCNLDKSFRDLLERGAAPMMI